MRNMKWVWLAALVAGVMGAGCGGGGGGGGDDEEVCDGDGRCTGDEDENNCPEDCESDCGNGVCQVGETAQNCAEDCVQCGNNTCDPGETQQNCAADCMPPPPACNNNGTCDATEQYATCTTDCAAKLRVQNNSSYTIFYLYVKRCTESVWGPDQLGASVISPNQAFTLGGIPPGCWNFKANDNGFVHTWQTPAGVTLQPGVTHPWTLIN